MIHITWQDADGQYDDEGRMIAEWNEKLCSWIVCKEFEEAYYKGEIDWWGEDNDFPGACTEKEYLEMFPGAYDYPDIMVSWTWDDEGYYKEFQEHTKEDVTHSNSWRHLNYTKEEAINRTGKYCKFNKYAKNVKVYYNGEKIFDGVLE